MKKFMHILCLCMRVYAILFLQAWAQKQMRKIFDKVQQLSDKRPTRRLVCQMFLELPSSEQYPDYYQHIEAPIALAQIGERLEASSQPGGAYADYDISAFRRDVKLLRSNACTYNQLGSQVCC